VQDVRLDTNALDYAILLTLLGVFASDEDIEQAADVIINLWAGLGMLAVALLFLVWAFTRPLGEELREAGEDDPSPHSGAAAPRGVDAAALASHQRGRRGRDDPRRAGDERDPGRE
jgi:hypothetical protein